MLFNSIQYLIFLPIVFFIYWVILKKSLKGQNVLLLLASYFFYSCWDWRFLILILASTILDYFVGLKIQASENESRRKWLLRTSVLFNLGLLFVFKYFNFFIDSFITLSQKLGFEADPMVLNIILPVGISFYTFQTLSYTLDIHKRKMSATKSFVNFATYVAFFPQLVAGPIERAANLLPQIEKKREFDYLSATDGLRQIMWGLAKKMIIADNCAPYVQEIFANHTEYSLSFLVIGVFLFAFQVYCDFSGYSDIAIGTAKMFNIKFKANFNYPYFSKGISEFWKKWHISLSSWLNDYVFTPFAVRFRDLGKHGMFISLFLTFLISGLWHGAGWNYVFWGGLHGLYYLQVIYSGKRLTSIATNRSIKNHPLQLNDIPRILITFFLVCLTYIFFRADNLGEAFSYLGSMFTPENIMISKEEIFVLGRNLNLIFTLFFILVLIIIEAKTFYKVEYPLQLHKLKLNKTVRWLIYCVVLTLTLLYMQLEPVEFIYFQF